MCLRFVFLLITHASSWLRLSQREETWKTAEILILRHQLAVLQRLTWTRFSAPTGAKRHVSTCARVLARHRAARDPPWRGSGLGYGSVLLPTLDAGDVGMLLRACAEAGVAGGDDGFGAGVDL